MWLVTLAVKAAIEQARDSGTLPTVAQQMEYVAAFRDQDGGGITTVAGDVGEIRVTGAITSAPDIIAMLFGEGNTTYSEITAALAQLDANPDVKRARMVFDSPGGTIDGLFDCIAAMQAFSKPLEGVGVNKVGSAAYALISQCDSIIASGPAVAFGSIGVAVDVYTGRDVVQLASTAAPKKRPDVSTEEGQAVIIEELDAYHELFAEAIATGRNTTVAKVNKEFGQGGVFLAAEALKRGMIDSIAKPSLKMVKSDSKQTTASGGQHLEASNMAITEQEAQAAKAEAAEAKKALADYKANITAHLEMGEASGCMDVALAAIKAGDEYTASYAAKYQSAMMKKMSKEGRQEEGDDLGGNNPSGSDGDDDVVAQALGLLQGSNGEVLV